MKESDIIDILMNYSSGGNYFVLYKIIVENSEEGWCYLSQKDLAEKMKKSRRFINDGLKILHDLELVIPLYKKIKITTDRKDNEKFKKIKT